LYLYAPSTTDPEANDINKNLLHINYVLVTRDAKKSKGSYSSKQLSKKTKLENEERASSRQTFITGC
jgi:hypothetical protein